MIRQNVKEKSTALLEASVTTAVLATAPVDLIARTRAVGLTITGLARAACVDGRRLYSNAKLRPDELERLESALANAKREANNGSTDRNR